MNVQGLNFIFFSRGERLDRSNKRAAICMGSAACISMIIISKQIGNKLPSDFNYHQRHQSSGED
jgi:hypothetical protein